MAAPERGAGRRRATLVVFPALAGSVHDWRSFEEARRARDLADEPLREIALAGPRRWARSLTGMLRLPR
jgi:hypothetical protein